MQKCLLALTAGVGLTLASAALAQPQYQIIDLGLLDPGDAGSQGFGISDTGTYATGRSLGVSNAAFLWTSGSGTAALPNLSSRPFGVGNSVNNAGIVVGTGAQTFFGSGAVPLAWDNGVVTELPLPAGRTVGRANDINNLGIAVGSAGGGSDEVAVVYDGMIGDVVTAVTTGGAAMTTAFAINDDNLVVGTGIDPGNVARNVGILYDFNSDLAVEVGVLPGDNGAILFDVSNTGTVVGSSSFNQAGGLPFYWTNAGGAVEIPLPANTSGGSARGVNDSGMVVGNAGGTFAVPWLFDGTQTYALEDLITNLGDWDLNMNTSSGADGISANGTIVGTGVLDGVPHAFVMVPVPEPAGLSLLALAGVALRRRR